MLRRQSKLLRSKSYPRENHFYEAPGFHSKARIAFLQSSFELELLQRKERLLRLE